MKRINLNLHQISEELKEIACRDYRCNPNLSFSVYTYFSSPFSETPKIRIALEIGYHVIGTFRLEGENLIAVPAFRNLERYSKNVESVTEGLHYLLRNYSIPLDWLVSATSFDLLFSDRGLPSAARKHLSEKRRSQGLGAGRAPKLPILFYLLI